MLDFCDFSLGMEDRMGRDKVHRRWNRVHWMIRHKVKKEHRKKTMMTPLSNANDKDQILQTLSEEGVKCVSLLLKNTLYV